MWYLPGTKPVFPKNQVIGLDGMVYTLPFNFESTFMESIGWREAPPQPAVNTFYCNIDWDVNQEKWTPVNSVFTARKLKFEEHQKHLIDKIRFYIKEARNEILDPSYPESMKEVIQAQYTNYFNEISRISSIVYENAYLDNLLTNFDTYTEAVELDESLNSEALHLYNSVTIYNLKAEPPKSYI